MRWKAYGKFIFIVAMGLACIPAVIHAQRQEPEADQGSTYRDRIELQPRSDRSINFVYPEARSVLDLYRKLGEEAGINVLFDPQLRDQHVSIELVDVAAEQALEFLCQTAGHFYKVLDRDTIIIAADTPQSRRAYEELVIQTFFLENANVRDMMTALRSLIDARKVTPNEDLGSITLRDTAAKSRVAELIVSTYDKRKSEVVVDVNLLAIGTERLLELAKGFSQSRVDEGGGVPLRISQRELAQIRAAKGARLVASPKLSLVGGAEATLTVSDLVPIATTLRTGGSDPVPLSYQDVGIELKVGLRTHPSQPELTLEVELAARGLTTEAGITGGEPPIVGSRSIRSSLRLADGETYLLSGLMHTAAPGPSSGPHSTLLPLASLLSGDAAGTPTELVLALSPRIVYRTEISDTDRLPIPVGTESRVGLRGPVR